MLSRLISGKISFDNEIEFGVRDTDYKVVWSLDNNAESGENVEDILEENEETGSILQNDTNKEDTQKRKPGKIDSKRDGQRRRF